jgi:hypothetical protein
LNMSNCGALMKNGMDVMSGMRNCVEACMRQQPRGSPPARARIHTCPIKHCHSAPG